MTISFDIASLLEQLNARAFQKLSGIRPSVFAHFGFTAMLFPGLDACRMIEAAMHKDGLLRYARSDRLT